MGHPDRATGWANVAFIGAAEERAETRLRAGPSGLGLTLGHNGRRDRVFAYWALADGIFADWIFADRRGGRDRLRPWEVGSNRCSHESQRHRSNDRESQHRSPLAAKVILELTLRSLTAQQKGSRAHVSAILFRWMLQNWHLVWAIRHSSGDAPPAGTAAPSVQMPANANKTNSPSPRHTAYSG